MTKQTYLGWVRDAKGRVAHRPAKQIANAVTAFCGSGGRYADPADGLPNTTPHKLSEFI